MSLDHDPLGDEVLDAARRERDRQADAERLERYRERASDPEVQRRAMSDAAEARAARAAARPTRGARGIGSVALIEPGCIIYSRTRSWGGTDDLTGELVDPIGGIVVQVVTEPVGDDGEFVRAFRVRWPYAGRNLLAVHVLTEDDVDVGKMEVAPSSTVVKLIRDLALGVGRKRANLFDSTDVVAIADCHHLVGSL